MQITTHGVTLPNLRWFSFWGISTYLEALLPHTATPLLRTFNIHFFNQPNFSVPRLLQFMTTTKNLRFSSAKFLFHHEEVAAFVYSRVGGRESKFSLPVFTHHLSVVFFYTSGAHGLSLHPRPDTRLVHDATQSQLSSGLHIRWAG